MPALTDHSQEIAWLLTEMRAHDGLAPLDIEQFWADQAVASANPFGADIPQVPLGVLMSWECVFDELGIPEDYWRYEQDAAWRMELNKAYNDRSELIVGRRLLSETQDDPSRRYPQTKGLSEIFEAKTIWHDRSWWLQESVHTEDELAALLDRVEACDVRKAILPDNWDEEKARLQSLGVAPPLYRGQRGPVTFATSIFGVENLLFLILDNPDLAIRFRDAILRTMLEIGRVLDEEAGYTPDTAPQGFAFFDDNCYLLTPDMYELFGFPVLEGVFARYGYGPGGWRYQHSDSAMAHLLPILARLQLTSVNFGPTIPVSEIRAQMPTTVIDGQLAPFTFSRNDEEGILSEFLRDFDMAREHRGLCFATAGSINNGSRLTGMRLIMSAIQHFGRY